MARQEQHLYAFGPFQVDSANRFLLRDSKPLPLTPKAFDILLLLVENHGQVLEKDRIMQAVWPDSFVEEANLTQHISTLRKVLGESPDHHDFIETIPRRGYRFVAPVSLLSPEPPEEVVVIRERTRTVIMEGDSPAAADAAPRALPPAPHFLLRSLGGLIAAAFLLLLAAVALLYFGMLKQTGGPVAVTDVKSIAVLPFKPLSGEPAPDDVLGLGMADALITKLGSLRQIAVRSTSAVRKYAQPRQDPLAAGRELSVDAVLDGSIQRSGERIRVTVQLLRLRDASTLWSGQFDERFTDIFAVQDSISQQVAAALTPQLTSLDRQRLAKRYTENTEAFQLYLMGRYFQDKRTEEGLRKGLEYFRQAIEKDPLYALAYSGLADSYLLLGNFDMLRPKEAYPLARAAAQKALSLDDSLAEAHASLAYILRCFDWDWPAAEKEFRRALALNPNYAAAHHWFAISLAGFGRSEESFREIARAKELDPLSLPILTSAGWIYYLFRRNDLAIAELQKALEMDPHYPRAHFLLGQVFEQQRMFPKAVAEIEKALGSPRPGDPHASLGYIYALTGRRAKAEKILREMTQLSRRRYVPAEYFAEIYIALGERDRAFEWLEQAFEQREAYLCYINVEPRYDSLRSDPRFRALLLRMSFPANR